MIRKLLFGFVCVVIGALAGCLICKLWEGIEMPLVHKLEHPLLLSGGDASQITTTMLPRGTTLYYDQAFPEGFVRYKVYVNVEGVKLDVTETNERFWIDPLTAFPIESENLRLLLRDYPLTKEDVAAILKSGQLSKQEIRELLAEYSK